MNPSAEQRNRVAALVGHPFARGARGPRAFDCLGLTLKGLEILRPDLKLEDPWTLLAAKWKEGWRPEPGEHFPPGFVRVSLKEIAAGDVLLVGTRSAKHPTLTHLDLVLWGTLILRTRLKTGATIEPIARILRRSWAASGPLGAMRPPGPGSVA